MIQQVIKSANVPIKIWTEDVESEAIDQLKNVGSLPFAFHHVAAMPDVQVGYGCPIGTVFAAKDVIVPALCGVDIGCGMMAVKTPFDADKVKALLPELKHSIERSIPTGNKGHMEPVCGTDGWRGWIEYNNLTFSKKASLRSRAEVQMGTLGGGNHFIEICIDETNAVWVLLHSGSRHVGLQIANYHIDIAKNLMKDMHIGLPDPYLAYLSLKSDQGKWYLSDALWAQTYAMENRRIMMTLISKDMAHLFNEARPWEPQETVNCHHNYVSLEHHFGQNVYITRKGAIRVQLGEMAIIPGSMGAKSFIVRGRGNPESFNSSSHGAGRAMSRKKAKESFTLEDLKAQTEGILCTINPGVIDEIPGAYKDIDTVMERQSDLVEPVHTLRQILCIKGG